MEIQVKRLTNVSLYINGGSHIGQASEIDLPTAVTKQETHSGLGMAYEVQYPSGIEALESRIAWSGPYETAMKLMADFFSMHSFLIMGNVEVYTANGREEKPFKAFMKGQSKQFPGGNYRQHQNTEYISMINVTYFKLTIDGESIIEMSPYSNTLKAGGVDTLLNFRTNIGG